VVVYSVKSNLPGPDPRNTEGAQIPILKTIRLFSTSWFRSLVSPMSFTLVIDVLQLHHKLAVSFKLLHETRLLLSTTLFTANSNAALYKAITADSQVKDPTAAIDGNIYTFSHSKKTNNPKWLQIDLGGSYSITKITITNRPSKLLRTTFFH